MVRQGSSLQEAHSPVQWAWDCWESRLDTVGGTLLEKVCWGASWRRGKLWTQKEKSLPLESLNFNKGMEKEIHRMERDLG